MYKLCEKCKIYVLNLLRLMVTKITKQLSLRLPHVRFEKQIETLTKAKLQTFTVPKLYSKSDLKIPLTIRSRTLKSHS